MHDFLKNLFLDGDLIPLPLQKYAAPWIARRRTPQIEQQYTDIGGGSPILRYTKLQGERMCELLDELHPETAPHKSYVAFRYAKPMTDETAKQLKADGVRRAIAFTQYPQYSCSTTGSSLNELYRRGRAGETGNGVEWSVIDRWGTHPGFIEVCLNSMMDQYLSDLQRPSHNVSKQPSKSSLRRSAMMQCCCSRRIRCPCPS